MKSSYIIISMFILFLSLSLADASLEDLPSPFIVSGEWNSLIVSGEEGYATDIIAAIDIYFAFAEDFEVHPEDTGSRLDIEIEDKTEKPMIIIGGPENNRIAADLMSFNYPAVCSESSKNCGYGVGEGIITFYENIFDSENPAILVAGWNAEDTRRAATVLASYKDYSLESNCYIVTGTLESPVISECDIDLEYYKQFAVSEEINESSNNDSSYNENDTVVEEELNNENETDVILCDGCSFNGNCIISGIRIDYEGNSFYCDQSNKLMEQKSANSPCNNNYECLSDLCTNNKCIETDFIKRIIDFIKNIFKI